MGDGTLHAQDCSITHNRAAIGRLIAYDGGGITVYSGTLHLITCTIRGNTGGSGGGVATMATCTVYVTTCTISGNTAVTGYGDGVRI